MDDSWVSDTGSDVGSGSDSCSGVDEEGLIKDGVSDCSVVVVGENDNRLLVIATASEVVGSWLVVRMTVDDRNSDEPKEVP